MCPGLPPPGSGLPSAGENPPYDPPRSSSRIPAPSSASDGTDSQSTTFCPVCPSSRTFPCPASVAAAAHARLCPSGAAAGASRMMPFEQSGRGMREEIRIRKIVNLLVVGMIFFVSVNCRIPRDCLLNTL